MSSLCEVEFCQKKYTLNAGILWWFKGAFGGGEERSQCAVCSAQSGPCHLQTSQSLFPKVSLIINLIFYPVVAMSVSWSMLFCNLGVLG